MRLPSRLRPLPRRGDGQRHAIICSNLLASAFAMVGLSILPEAAVASFRRRGRSPKRHPGRLRTRAGIRSNRTQRELAGPRSELTPAPFREWAVCPVGNRIEPTLFQRPAHCVILDQLPAICDNALEVRESHGRPHVSVDGSFAIDVRDNGDTIGQQVRDGERSRRSCCADRGRPFSTTLVRAMSASRAAPYNPLTNTPLSPECEIW